MNDNIYLVAVTVAVEARIHELLKQRKRDRRWYGADWSPARHDRETELRALLRLRSSARRLARRTVEQTATHEAPLRPSFIPCIRCSHSPARHNPLAEGFVGHEYRNYLDEPERTDPVTAAKAASDRDFHAWQSEGPWQ